MIFSSLFTLVEKNLKVFFRSKISSSIIILMPFLIVLFAGYGFGSNNLSGISIATYSNSYSNVSENILSGFEKQGFLIKKQNSLEDCVNSVKISKTQICISFPENLSQEGNKANIIFYVDYSRMNLAYNLINILNKQVSFNAKNVGVVRAQDLINTLNSLKSTLKKEKSKADLLPENFKEAENLGNSIESPVENIDSILADLEKLDSSLNSSEDLESSISDLNSVKSKVSNNFENLEKLTSKNKELKSQFNDVLIDLGSSVDSLNSFKIVSAENIVSPFNISLESITPSNKKREYLIPIIISLISLFAGILISSTLVLKNKKTRAYFRNFVTPTSDFTFVFSIYLTCLIILFLQFLFVFAGIYFIFKMNFFALPLEMISILILGLSAFISIGMFLGYVFRSEETIIFSSILVASILMFFSNIILPLENISPKLLKFASFNPLVLLENSLNKIYLFGLGFNFIWLEAILLGSVFLFFGILTYFMRKMTKRIL